MKEHTDNDHVEMPMYSKTLDIIDAISIDTGLNNAIVLKEFIMVGSKILLELISSKKLRIDNQTIFSKRELDWVLNDFESREKKDHTTIFRFGSMGKEVVLSTDIYQTICDLAVTYRFKKPEDILHYFTRIGRLLFAKRSKGSSIYLIGTRGTDREYINIFSDNNES